MKKTIRNYGMTALVLLMATVAAPSVFAADQNEDNFSHLDGLAYNDCSVVCDELHYSDSCHAYRSENPCPAIDDDMTIVAGQ